MQNIFLDAYNSYFEEDEEERRKRQQQEKIQQKREESTQNIFLKSYYEKFPVQQDTEKVTEKEEEINIPQPEPEKKSIWEKIKGIFSKAKEEVPKFFLGSDEKTDLEYNAIRDAYEIQSDVKNRLKQAELEYEAELSKAPTKYKKEKVEGYFGKRTFIEEGTQDPEKLKELETRIRLLRDADEGINELVGISRSNKGLFARFADNIKDIKYELPYSAYYSKKAENEYKLSALEKFYSGEELSEKEKSWLAVYKAETINTLTKHGYGDLAADIATGSISLGANMYFTAMLTGDISAGTKPVIDTLPIDKGQGLVSKVMKNSVQLAAQSRYSIPSIESKTAEYMLPTLDYEAYLSQEEGKDVDILDYLKEGDDYTKASRKANIAELIEFVSEGLGDYIDDALPVVKKMFVGKFLKNANIKPSETSLVKTVLKGIHLNSIVGEVIEEEAAEPFLSFIEERPYKDPIFTPEGRERLLVETLGMSVMRGMAKVSDVTINNMLKWRKDNDIEPFKIEVDKTSREGLVTQMYTTEEAETSFQEAISKLGGEEQQELMKESDNIAKKYNADVIERKEMIGDTATYGTERSMMETLRIDEQTSKVISAEKGLLGKEGQKTILNFVYDESGTDYLVEFNIGHDLTLEEIRDILNKEGLEYRSLNKDTKDIVIYDGGGESLDTINNLIKKYEGTGKAFKGRGEFIGSDASRAEARKIYKEILSSYHRKQGRVSYADNKLPEAQREVKTKRIPKTLRELSSYVEKYDSASEFAKDMVSKDLDDKIIDAFIKEYQPTTKKETISALTDLYNRLKEEGISESKKRAIKNQKKVMESKKKNEKVSKQTKKIRENLKKKNPKDVKTSKKMRAKKKSEDRYQVLNNEISLMRISKEEATEMFRKYFDVNEVGIDFVDNILSDYGAEVLGKYGDGMVTFLKNPDISTPPHEAFHAFLDLFTRPERKAEILKWVMNNKKIKSEYEAEEWLANDFAKYVVQEQHKTRFRKLYDSIINFFKRFVSGENKIQDLYKDIINKKRDYVKSKEQRMYEHFSKLQKRQRYTTKTIKEIENALKSGSIGETIKKDVLLQRFIDKGGVSELDKSLLKRTLSSFDDVVNVEEFINSAKANAMPMEVIVTDKFATYSEGYLKSFKESNLGQDQMVFDKLETHIYNTPFIRTPSGKEALSSNHFLDFMLAREKNKGKNFQIQKRTDPDLGIDYFFVLPKDYVITPENIESAPVIYIGRSMEEATEYIDRIKNEKATDWGMFGHTRMGYVTSDPEHPAVYVLEKQSDPHQSRYTYESKYTVALERLGTARGDVERQKAEINSIKKNINKLRNDKPQGYESSIEELEKQLPPLEEKLSKLEATLQKEEENFKKIDKETPALEKEFVGIGSKYYERLLREEINRAAHKFIKKKGDTVDFYVPTTVTTAVLERFINHREGYVVNDEGFIKKEGLRREYDKTIKNGWDAELFPELRPIYDAVSKGVVFPIKIGGELYLLAGENITGDMYFNEKREYQILWEIFNQGTIENGIDIPELSMAKKGDYVEVNDSYKRIKKIDGKDILLEEDYSNYSLIIPFEEIESLFIENGYELRNIRADDKIVLNNIVYEVVDTYTGGEENITIRELGSVDDYSGYTAPYITDIEDLGVGDIVEMRDSGEDYIIVKKDSDGRLTLAPNEFTYQLSYTEEVENMVNERLSDARNGVEKLEGYQNPVLPNVVGFTKEQIDNIIESDDFDGYDWVVQKALELMQEEGESAGRDNNKRITFEDIESDLQDKLWEEESDFYDPYIMYGNNKVFPISGYNDDSFYMTDGDTVEAWTQEYYDEELEPIFESNKSLADFITIYDLDETSILSNPFEISEDVLNRVTKERVEKVVNVDENEEWVWDYRKAGLGDTAVAILDNISRKHNPAFRKMRPDARTETDVRGLQWIKTKLTYEDLQPIEVYQTLESAVREYAKERRKITKTAQRKATPKPNEIELWKQHYKNKLGIELNESKPLDKFLLDYSRIADPNIKVSDDEIETIAKELLPKVNKAISTLKKGKEMYSENPAIIDDLIDIKKSFQYGGRLNNIEGIDALVHLQHDADLNVLPIIFRSGITETVGKTFMERQSAEQEVLKILNELATVKQLPTDIAQVKPQDLKVKQSGKTWYHGTGEKQTVLKTAGYGRKRVSKLGVGVEMKAIENQLTEGFQDIPEYRQIDIKNQLSRATKLVEEDYDSAVKIALGKEQPKYGLLPESVFTVVENKALADGDVDLLRQLASSVRVTEATAMGQRIRVLAERNPDSAVTKIREVIEARRRIVEKRKGYNVDKEVKKLKEEVNKEVKKITKGDWLSFIDSIEC